MLSCQQPVNQFVSWRDAGWQMTDNKRYLWELYFTYCVKINNWHILILVSNLFTDQFLYFASDS